MISVRVIPASRCETTLSIDVRHWSRQDKLRSGITFTQRWLFDDQSEASIAVEIANNSAILHYTLVEQTQAICQKIPLVWTACRLGGRRAWFVCPGHDEPCLKRAAVLYLAADGFGCRTCAGVTYASQSEPKRLRGITKAQKIRMKLGGSGNLLVPFPVKPKRMHRRTYQRLRKWAVAREKSILS
jgi:hypothetical protein